MVKTPGTHRRFIAEAALHLICHGESREKIASRTIRIFSRRKDGAQVVAGMTSLALGEITVVKIQIPNQCAIVEGGTIGCGPAATDQRARLIPPEVVKLLAQMLDGFGG